MPVGVVNANQVESSEGVVNVFNSSAANVLLVFFLDESIGKGPSVVRTLQGIHIGFVRSDPTCG